MPDQKQINSEVNYDDQRTVVDNDVKITTELFISHCTKTRETMTQFYFVSKLSEILKKDHNISNFFDDKDMNSYPFEVMNQYLDSSRSFIAICTPNYIFKVMHQKGSYPSQELASFHTFQNSSEKNRIIPVLLDVSIKEFQQQGKGIPLINHNKLIVVSPDYRVTEKAEEIVKGTAEEIVKLHNEMLKQWL